MAFPSRAEIPGTLIPVSAVLKSVHQAYTLRPRYSFSAATVGAGRACIPIFHVSWNPLASADPLRHERVEPRRPITVQPSVIYGQAQRVDIQRRGPFPCLTTSLKMPIPGNTTLLDFRQRVFGSRD